MIAKVQRREGPRAVCKGQYFQDFSFADRHLTKGRPGNKDVEISKFDVFFILGWMGGISRIPGVMFSTRVHGCSPRWPPFPHFWQFVSHTRLFFFKWGPGEQALCCVYFAAWEGASYQVEKPSLTKVIFPKQLMSWERLSFLLFLSKLKIP